jgi:3D (Asp-Asp-Asp) domain-containing protein
MSDKWWKGGQQIDVRIYRRDYSDWAFAIGIFVIIAFFIAAVAWMMWPKTADAGEVWKITSYCACQKCCGKTDAITASGKKAQYGMVACNWLPFGTKVKVEGLGVFTVQDRGAKSQFGSKTNHIKHIDVYLPTHKQALQFGVKWLEVEVLNV